MHRFGNGNQVCLSLLGRPQAEYSCTRRLFKHRWTRASVSTCTAREVEVGDREVGVVLSLPRWRKLNRD